MAKGSPRVKVTDKDKGYAQFVAQFRKMAEGRHVVVGIRGEKGVEKEEGADLTLVEIAAVNEFGTEDGHIPSRPAFRGTFDANRPKYETRLVAGVNRVLAGKSDMDTELERLGLVVVGDIQKAISAGIAPANAPRTIAAKGSEKPLIDTGRTRQAIDSEVRVKARSRAR